MRAELAPRKYPLEQELLCRCNWVSDWSSSIRISAAQHTEVHNFYWLWARVQQLLKQLHFSLDPSWENEALVDIWALGCRLLHQVDSQDTLRRRSAHLSSCSITEKQSVMSFTDNNGVVLFKGDISGWNKIWMAAFKMTFWLIVFYVSGMAVGEEEQHFWSKWVTRQNHIWKLSKVYMKSHLKTSLKTDAIKNCVFDLMMGV